MSPQCIGAAQAAGYCMVKLSLMFITASSASKYRKTYGRAMRSILAPSPQILQVALLAGVEPARTVDDSILAASCVRGRRPCDQPIELMPSLRLSYKRPTVGDCWPTNRTVRSKLKASCQPDSAAFPCSQFQVTQRPGLSRACQCAGLFCCGKKGCPALSFIAEKVHKLSSPRSL